MKVSSKRLAFSLIELLVVISVIGILLAILLPAVQSIRAAARKTECANRIKQIALATHNYHDSNKRFPSGIATSNPNFRMAGHSNAFTAILPFIELTNLSRSESGVQWATEIIDFQCPSSASLVAQNGGPDGGACDYAFCKGDNSRLAFRDNPGRGIFGVNSKTAMFSIFDGTSRTMMIGEAASDPSIDSHAT